MRGSVALERGPIVYCLEQDDITLDGVVVDPDSPAIGAGEAIEVEVAPRKVVPALYGRTTPDRASQSPDPTSRRGRLSRSLQMARQSSSVSSQLVSGSRSRLTRVPSRTMART